MKNTQIIMPINSIKYKYLNEVFFIFFEQFQKVFHSLSIYLINFVPQIQFVQFLDNGSFFC
jgi:hypothetical protein